MNPKEEIEQHRRALKMDPENAEAHLRLAIAYSESGWFLGNRKARPHFKEAVRLNPKDAEARYRLAECLSGFGEKEEALEHYREAIKLKPDHIEAHYGMGLAFLDQEEFDEAIAHLKEVIRLDPDDSEALTHLGEAYYEKGDLTHAEESYRDALKVDPSNMDARYFLAEILLERDRLDEAASQFAEVVKRDHENKSGLVEDAIDELSRIPYPDAQKLVQEHKAKAVPRLYSLRSLLSILIISSPFLILSVIVALALPLYPLFEGTRERCLFCQRVVLQDIQRRKVPFSSRGFYVNDKRRGTCPEHFRKGIERAMKLPRVKIPFP